MQRLAARTILAVVIFAVVWIVMTLVFGGDTSRQLVTGALAAVSFGIAYYWWGKRTQQSRQNE